MKNKVLPFEDMPPLVAFVRGMAFIEQPIGYSTFEKAITEHPEWFPEEVEHKRKWDLIPEEVKDSFFKNNLLFPTEKEYEEYETILGERPNPDLPGGIFNWVENPGLYKERDEWDTKMFAIRTKKQHEEFNRIFAPYGITKKLT